MQVAAHVSEADGAWRLDLRVVQASAKPLRFKLPLRLRFDDGSTSDTAVDVIPSGGSFSTVVGLELPKQPVAVEPDPERVLLRLLYPLNPGDVDYNGLIDGSDLAEVALRAGEKVLWWSGPASGFGPTGGWDERFDAWPDHRIDQMDADVVVEHAGEETPPL
jgi:hypothetical protein